MQSSTFPYTILWEMYPGYSYKVGCSSNLNVFYLAFHKPMGENQRVAIWSSLVLFRPVVH